MLDWDKGKKQDIITKADYIQSMGREMDSICEMLSEESQLFNEKNFFEKIHEYIVHNDRLIYTQITNYIFVLDDVEFGILQTNIDSVVNYMYGEQYKEDFRTILEGKEKILKLN